MTEEPANRHFEELLEFLRTSRGFDFTGYKRPSLARRINRRMDEVGVKGYDRYVEYLELHAEEFTSLFNTILINVTGFFRDPDAWQHLEQEILPKIVAGEGLIRVWSAGCASGEEAYTLAILLTEALGAEAFNERVKIYATDVDEEALAAARHATYGAKSLEAVPEPLRAKYFQAAGAQFVFRPDLRRALIFGRHDLIQDAPISRLDLLVCRNTLMYLDSETQERILTRFFFALRDTGYLFLGKAEMLFSRSQLFTPVDLRNRMFVKAVAAAPRDRMLAVVNPQALHNQDHEVARLARLRDLAADSSPLANLVITWEGLLVHVNERARALFGLSPDDLGRPFKDLEISYRPVELRARIEQAYADRRPLELSAERVQPGEGRQVFRVLVRPFFEGGETLGVAITFEEVSELTRVKEELGEAKQQLETALEELQSTNEELETTNEELQSTNEELETTNEELQSTNEELETMNEELQSTNAELDTINKELQERTERFEATNLDLEAILSSIETGIVVLDRDAEVRLWSRRAEDLWGVRGDEARGQSIFAIDFGLPAEELRGLLRATMRGDRGLEPLLLEATNRRGKKISCRVSSTPLRGANGDTIDGAILLMEEWAGITGKAGAAGENPGLPAASGSQRRKP